MATDFSPGGIEASLGTATDKWKAAYIENIYGNVEGTIDKATKDANGNVIHTYYTPKDNLKSKGNATTPVYIDANGVAQPITSYGGKADTAGEADTAKACTGNAASATKATNDKNGNDIAATYVPLSNEAYKAVTANGIHHNGIYRGKNFGVFATLAEFDKFLADHNVSEGVFTDLYLGDYFTIQDGTYNKMWEIAGLDVYLNKGDTAFTAHHLALIPKNNLFTSKMNDTNDTTGGYYNSYMHQTVIPQVNANLANVLGSHLLTRRALLSNTVNKDVDSSAGAGWKGSSTGWAWYDVKAVLMSEVAVYGSTVFGSSSYDVGEDCERLPIYQFKNHVVSSREWFWLKAVASGANFASAVSYGDANSSVASDSGGGVRPLICVG